MSDKPQDAETKPHKTDEKPPLRVVGEPDLQVKIVDRILERTVEYRVTQTIEVGKGEDAKQMMKRGIIREHVRVDPKSPIVAIGKPEFDFVLIPMRQGMMPLTVKMETYTTLEEVFQHGFEVAEKAYEEVETRRRQAALAQGLRPDLRR